LDDFGLLSTFPAADAAFLPVFSFFAIIFTFFFETLWRVAYYC
jgi:hypothetical protein